MFNRDTFAVLAILAVVSLSYFNALSNGFVFDDIPLVERNMRLRMGWDGIPAVFTSGYWMEGGGLYRPLAMLTYLAEYSLVGARPFLYHLDNVILHLMCSVLVYLVVKPLSVRKWTAVFAALLFAAHPVHAEAVAWVSGRAELLAVLFTLLSFWLYVRKPAGHASAPLSYAVFFLGLMSKETAVVLPVLLGAYILLFDKEPSLKLRSRRIAGLYPFGVAFAGYMLLRFAVLGYLGPTGEEKALGLFTPYQTFIEMCEALFHYVRIGFLPFSLAIDYIYKPADSLLNYKVALPLVTTSAIVIFSTRIAKVSRSSLFAVIWFYVALLPVSNIVSTGIVMSERAMYLPTVGICLLLGLLFAAAYDTASSKRTAYLTASVLMSCVVMFSVGTFKRNPVWKDEADYFGLLAEGWKKRIELSPGYAPFYSDMALEYLYHNELGPETENAARTAVRLDDKDAVAHYCLAIINMDRGNLQEALREMQTVVELRKYSDGYKLKNFEVYYGLANIYIRLGRAEDALDALETSLKLKETAAAHSYASHILHSLGRVDEAVGEARRAVELDPDNEAAAEYLGSISREAAE